MEWWASRVSVEGALNNAPPFSRLYNYQNIKNVK
jgi:hypothetical protein